MTGHNLMHFGPHDHHVADMIGKTNLVIPQGAPVHVERAYHGYSILIGAAWVALGVGPDVAERILNEHAVGVMTKEDQ